jgi:hypothetical protein
MVKYFAVGIGVLVLMGCGSAGDPNAAADSPVRLNEFCPSNATLAADEAGEYDDWIELVNPSADQVSVAGYYISDGSADPLRYALPDGVVVPAHGYLLLWADGQTAQGAAHLPFKLKAAAEGLYFSNPDGNLIDGLDYASAPADQSMSRYPDGTGDFVWCAAPTPGRTNDPSCVP